MIWAGQLPPGQDALYGTCMATKDGSINTKNLQSNNVKNLKNSMHTYIIRCISLVTSFWLRDDFKPSCMLHKGNMYVSMATEMEIKKWQTHKQTGSSNLIYIPLMWLQLFSGHPLMRLMLWLLRSLSLMLAHLHTPTHPHNKQILNKPYVLLKQQWI